MKRGKRQIVQKSNLFEEQENSVNNYNDNKHNLPTYYQNNSFNYQKQDKIKIDNVHTHNAVLTKKQQKKIFHDQDTREVKKQNINYKKMQKNEQVNNNVFSSPEDQRKKRLQMLRQKYLKNNSQSSEIKQENINRQIRHVQQSNKQTEYKKQIQVVSSQQQSNNQNRYDQQQENNLYLERHEKVQDEPISKPTQNSQIKKPIVPSAPLGQKKKAVPPPPRSVTAHQLEQNIQKPQISSIKIQNQSEAINFGFFQQSQQNLKKNDKKTKQNKNKKTVQEIQIRKQNNDTNQQNLQQVIQKWITNSKNENKIKLNNKDNQQGKVKQIIKQICSSSDEFFYEVVQSFIINNHAEYSQNQKRIVVSQLLSNRDLSSLTKVFIAIKCGSDTLNKYCTQIMHSEIQQILSQISTMKHHFLQSELFIFISYCCSNLQIQESNIKYLIDIAPKQQSLCQLLSNYQFTNAINIAHILQNISKNNNIQQSMCSIYFKLVNKLILFIQQEYVLQEILNIINNINYKSAYQIKKDTKLKIIQKIDRIGNKTSTLSDSNSNNKIRNYAEQNQNHSSPYHNLQQKKVGIQQTNGVNIQKQSTKDKGFGINFKGMMSQVNQAIKKLANQIPQKTQPQKSKNIPQEPQDTIVYDPVLKRYLINGKVPQDQFGNTETATIDQSQSKPKKKAPPPPKLGSRKSQQKKQAEPTNLPQPQTQQYTHNQQNPNNYNYQVKDEQQQKPTAFPAPRVGIKGMASKKPKIQIRYA